MFRKFLSYTKTHLAIDFNYVFKGTFWLTSSHVLGAGFTALSTIALANLLEPADFGSYKYVIAFAGFLGSFSLTGIGLGVTRAIARGHTGILQPAFKVRLLWSSGTCLAALLCAAYYFYADNNFLGISFLVIATTVPIIDSALLHRSFWEGKKDFRRVGLYSVITTIGYSLPLLLVVYFTENVLLAVIVYFLCQMLTTLFFYYRSQVFDAGSSSIAEIIEYSKHISFVNILSMAAAHLDKILVFKFLGAEALALYALIQLPYQQAQTLLKLPSQLVFPKYAKYSVHLIKRTIYKKMSIFLFIVVIFVLCYFLLAPFFYTIVFPQYTEAAFYSQILMLALLFYPKKLISLALLAHAEKKIIYIISLSTSIFKIGAIIILIPPLGVWGAIAAILLTQFYNTIASFLLLKRLN